MSEPEPDLNEYEDVLPRGHLFISNGPPSYEQSNILSSTLARIKIS